MSHRVLFVFCAATALFAQPDSRTVIRTEKREVLVDAVVTDKKGSVVEDLTSKDFKLSEDGKDQDINSVIFQSGAAANPERPQYMVLFFDNAHIRVEDQMHARDAAAKFVARNAGPNRPMAVIDFTGSVRITQNFTTNVDRLKAAVAHVQSSVFNTSNDTFAGMPNLSALESNFGARNSLLALGSVAKSLSSVPGRKTLVLLTSGFALDPELQSEVTAAINTCNRANVAVYPIDVRGLATGLAGAEQGGRIGGMAMALPHSLFQTAAFAPPSAWLSLAMQARSPGNPGNSGNSPAPNPGRGTPPNPSPNPGAGGGTRTAPNFPTAPGGGTRNPSPTPSPGRGGGMANTNPMPANFPRDPFANRIGRILPDIGSISGTQQVLHLLAEGTGGFVILNSNDLLGGLEKIGRDQNAYYVLAYTPPETDEGSCHSIKVKAGKGLNVRARTGYCNARPVDALAGESSAKTLEARLSAEGAGGIQANFEAPYFYSAPQTARVNVALELPFDALHFEKKKGKFRTTLNILGIAYRDGQVAARFSDAVPFEYENKKDMEANAGKLFFYESQFEIAPGQYTLKLAFESGDNKFGKLERPLRVEPWDGKTMWISDVAFAKQIRPVAQMGNSLADLALDERHPLLVEGMQVTPAARNRVRSNAQVNGIYLELYDPLLAGEKPPAIAVQVRVLDASGQPKADSGMARLDPASYPAGSAMVPLGLSVPVAGLTPGQYQLEVSALDGAGHKVVRKAPVTVE